MRTSAVAFAALLLLLFLATRAHGIRLDRQLHEALSSKETGYPKSGASSGEASSIADSTTKHCAPDGSHCSGKEKRALAHAETAGAKQQQQQRNSSTGSVHSTTTVDAAEAARQGRRHVAQAATSSRAHGGSPDASAAFRGVARERQTYPDIMDIAGMDYTPATRKPPIHN